MSEKRFVITPGYVISQNDGQEHWIDALSLMKLYAVERSECVIVEAGQWTPSEYKHLPHLGPRYDGNYDRKGAKA